MSAIIVLPRLAVGKSVGADGYLSKSPFIYTYIHPPLLVPSCPGPCAITGGKARQDVIKALEVIYTMHVLCDRSLGTPRGDVLSVSELLEQDWTSSVSNSRLVHSVTLQI